MGSVRMVVVVEPGAKVARVVVVGVLSLGEDL